VTLELTEIEIEVQGHPVNCRAYNNDAEYQVESADLPAVAVAECVKALRRESRRRTGKQLLRIGLELDISESEKAVRDYNVLGIWMDCKASYIDLQFTANSPIGMHHPDVQDIVQSRLHGTDFSLCEIRTGDFERPPIPSDGYRSWVLDIRLPLSSDVTFQELLRMRGLRPPAVPGNAPGHSRYRRPGLGADAFPCGGKPAEAEPLIGDMLKACSALPSQWLPRLTIRRLADG
jgi:hypothetical protein